MSADVHSVVLSTTDGAGIRLHLVGDLDAVAVDRLRALLDDAAQPGGEVVVDLSRATTLPIGVLRALAVAHRRLNAGTGSLAVVDPSAAAARALRTSGLHRVLRITGWSQPTDDERSSGAAEAREAPRAPATGQAALIS